jgi:hypothetical protein
MTGQELEIAAIGKAVMESRRRANVTRAAAGPSTKLLSTKSITPDPRVGATGRLRLLRAYDLGSPPPVLPGDAAGHAVQKLDAASTVDFVLDRVGGSFRVTLCGLRSVQSWTGWSGSPVIRGKTGG